MVKEAKPRKPKKAVKKEAEKPALGRPTDYHQRYDELARNYCLLGATDKDLARFFETTEQTINNWKIKHPSFFESLKQAKEEADGKVAASLFQRATGYSHPEVHISNYQGEITVTPLTKHYPPDATSMIFWLKNRQKTIWREQVVHTGGNDPGDKPIQQQVGLAPESLEALTRLNKRLAARAK